MSSPCPHCGDIRTREILAEKGPHYARLVCAGCLAFLRWVPMPVEAPGCPPVEVLQRIHPRTLPAPLRGGTARQRAYAGVVRFSLLHRLQKAGKSQEHAMALCVVDPTWFLAHQDRRVDALRWPAPEQMEGAEPTGTCAHCGAPAYDEQECCSDECAEQVRQQALLGAEPGQV